MAAEIFRIEWREQRRCSDGSSELFLIIAERGDSGWHFYERSSFEVRWFPVSPNASLIQY